MTLTRAKFDELTADLVEKTIGPVNKALKDANLTPDQIDKVILVGGSTRIPAVQAAVKKITNKDPFKGINPDECVAVGAAIQAGVLGGEVKDVLLLDVTPLSQALKPRVTSSPSSSSATPPSPPASRRCSPPRLTAQTAVEIHVLQGERTHGLRQQDAGPLPADRYPRRAAWRAADRGYLQHRPQRHRERQRQGQGHRNEQKITITASTNMTEEEINQRVKEAEQYAEQDKKRKEEVEIQNRADTLIYEMEKQLRENGDKLDSADKETVQHEIDEFKKVREGGDNRGPSRAPWKA